MSKSSYGAALRRAQELGGVSPSASRHDQGHEHEKTNQGERERKIHRINSNPLNQDQDHENPPRHGDFVGVDESGKPITKGRTSLAKIVNSDPTFLMAQREMGIRPDGLTYHCKRLGLDRVRKILLHFSTWQDAYFQNRAGYVMRVIQNCTPTDTDAVPNRLTEDYRRWMANNGHTR